MYFSLTLFWIFCYLFIAPFLNKNIKNLDQDVYYTYFFNFSLVYLKSFVFWVLIQILLYLTIFSFFTLFDISYNKIYLDLTITAIALFSPIFWLTQIPQKEKIWNKHLNENVFFTFITKYVAIPFIIVFFIILYSYTVKVLLNITKWPISEVSWMVIWFSFFGYAIYVFSYVFEQNNCFVKKYRKILPYIVLPQTLMLFYSMFVRIRDFDITINRYFVVVFWIFLVLISLYFIFSKIKNLIFIPALLTLITIIISIWPWWVYSLPQSRQYSRLITNLEKAWLYVDWKAIIPEKPLEVEYELWNNINSWIEYICDFDDCKKIKNLYSDFYKELEKKDREESKNNYSNEQDFNKTYKFSNYLLTSELKEKLVTFDISSKIDDTNNYLYFSYEEKDIFPLDIKGYDKIESIYWELDINNPEISLWDEKINISEFTKKILENYKINKKTKLKTIDLTYVISKNNIEYKIIFTNLTLKNPNYTKESKDNYYWYNAYVLVK